MIASILLLAQLAPVAAPEKPIVATIAAIRADPRKFDGRLVRLNGWVNACQPSSCAIDEHAATAPGVAGERLSVGENKKFDDIIRPLLPTFVEFDARLNAACPTAAVCSDPGPVLTIVTLRGVVSPEPPPIEN
jgi:hypothetical protein